MRSFGLVGVALRPLLVVAPAEVEYAHRTPSISGADDGRRRSRVHGWRRGRRRGAAVPDRGTDRQLKLFYEVHGDGPAVVFLDRLKIDRVALVGQSMGGSTVLGFASKHPERVSAVVLSDTTGGYTSPEIDQLRKTLTSTRTAFAPGYADREPTMAFLYREISALTMDDASPAGTATPPASPPTDIAPIVAKRVPTLLIVGELDQLLPPPIVEAMHRQMPGSELVKVTGAGHSVYFEKPVDYNRLLLDFLGRHART
jgi:pimeloyl-ACP methyl ester carboxylesterase